MTRVKICGLTHVEDAVCAAEAGADYLGFIFYPKSPRCADPDTVARSMAIFAGEVRYKTLYGVGVFVSPTPEQVKQTLKDCGLHLAQIHGVNAAELAAIRAAVYGAAYAAIQPRSLDEALTGLAFLDHDAPELSRVPGWSPQLLMDAYHPQLHGGTGQRADFDIAREMNQPQRVPRLGLAGGLMADNVTEAIKAVRPYMVDVASGVEAAPGKKDHGKVQAFIRAVQQIDSFD